MSSKYTYIYISAITLYLMQAIAISCFLTNRDNSEINFLMLDIATSLLLWKVLAFGFLLITGVLLYYSKPVKWHSPGEGENRELFKLYEELAVSEEMLRLQNEELHKQKDAMEEAHSQLELQKNFFEQIFIQSPISTVIYDSEGWCVRVNPGFCKVFGVYPNEVEGKIVNILNDEESKLQGIYQHICVVFQEQKSCEWSMPFNMSKALRTREDNTKISKFAWLYCKAYPIKNKDGGLKYVIAQLEDITDKKKKEEEIQFLFYHDRLTQLYNRYFVEKEIKKMENEKKLPFTVIMADVDGLKLTNDVFGQKVGDQLLINIADRIKETFLSDSIISRWGGDEFAVLLPNTNYEAAKKMCSLLKSACEKINNGILKSSISVGICTRESLNQSMDEVIKIAEDRMYRHKLLEGNSIRNSNISSLVKTLFERSYETEEHARRMTEIAERFGAAIGLRDNELDELKLFCMLHDIGKIGISDSILMKPEGLTSEEWNEMKKHTEIGFRIAMASSEISHIAEYILTHHERWDGKGYPNGLEGSRIPLLSRILTIVDAYDVMTHARIYKKPICHEDAIERINMCSGTQFDPELVGVFIGIMN